MTPESYLPVSWRPKKISEDEMEMGTGEEPLPIKKISPMDGVPEEPTALEKFLGIPSGPAKIAEVKNPIEELTAKKILGIEQARQNKATYDWAKKLTGNRKPKPMIMGRGNEARMAIASFSPPSEEQNKLLTEVESNKSLQDEINRFISRRGLGKRIQDIRAYGSAARNSDFWLPRG
jgi:hypothetical protein